VSVVADRFEILSLAGQGGMGKVFRARDAQSGTVVALKQLTVLDADAAQRFDRESEALARLEHPGVVRHVAHGLNDGVPYLAMQWVDGEELRLRLKREGVLEPAQVVMLAKRLAAALAHAHGRGIVHRDIKPSNVVLPTPDLADAVIIDFGLARTEDDELTRTGMLVGTPIYMAPEQVRDNAVTPSVDVFALGCVMYQCLAQTTPFAANGATAVLTRVLFDEPVPLERIVPGVPHALAELVASMLRKAPSERPTMRDVEGALAELDDGRATIPAAPKLSTAEQRVVSVIALGAPAQSDEGATLRQSASASVDAEVLGAIAARHGARASTLPNGAAVVVVEAEGAASDLAARAAECALSLKRAMPDVPVSLATGRARQTGEGLPLGEAIDRAVALEPFDGDAVRVDEVTSGLLGARMTIEEGGLLRRTHGDHESRTFLGKPAPCVGRDAELASLDGMIAQSASELVARVALVTGAPGVGKSRIRLEIVARCEQRRTNVWVGRGDPTSAGVPFGILSQMIRRQAGVAQEDASDVAREKLRTRVARFVASEDVARVAAFLGEIAAVRFEDEGVQLRAARGDPQLMGDQMQRAFVDFVDAECRDAPLVLVLEDLQWGDAPTIAAIDAALRVLEERPLAVIAFARPEVTTTFDGLWDKRRVQPLPLAPLPKRAATRLARSVLGDKTPDDLVGALVDKAAGNVFFLEELLRAEASGRAGEVPATVVAMVQSRLGALDADARRVLRAASILGGAFGGAGVRALLGDDRVDVDRWLAALTTDEVLARGETGHRVTYAFRHALVREGAYAMLTDEDRTLGHRLAAEWLAKELGEAAPLVVAWHYELAGESTKAAAAYLEAAEQSLESSDLGGAITNAERGVTLGAAGELLGALRVVQAQAHHWRGETEAMQSRAAEAVTLLSPQEPRWADAMTLLAVGKQRLGSTSDLASVAEKLQAMLERQGGSRAALARAGGRVASLLFFAGKQDRAAAMLDAAEQAARDGGSDVIARIHQARAPHARQAGRPEEALAHAEAAEAAFRAAGDLRNACLMSGIRGFALSELGAYAEAEGVLRTALVTAERLGLATVAATARSNLGMVCLRLGRADEAEAEERAAIRAFEASDRRHEGGGRAYLALMLREAGALDDAEKEARRALVLLDAALALKPFAGAVLASILLAAGRATEALAVARDAMRWPEAGNRIEEGESLLRLTLARALLATGHASEARAALALARDRIALRADTIRRADLRQTFLASVPEHATTLELAASFS
jgi:tetratricopeptide (TPR) repeat protein